MNSVSIVYLNNINYYLELGKEGQGNYYTSDLDPQGIFLGEGAKELGIYGDKIEHQDKRLKHLFNGCSPDGKSSRKQVQKDRTYYLFTDPKTNKTKVIGKAKAETIFRENPQLYKTNVKTKVSRAISGFDNVFSAPKDVDVIWALAPTSELRHQIHNYHKEAVKEAIKSFDNYVKSRSGKGGKNHVSAKLVLAVFDHTTSRELDPNLHTHVVMLNLGKKPDEHWGSLYGETILKEGRYISGQVYQNSLRRQIEKGLGLTTKDRPFEQGKGKSFYIEGLGTELKREFSKRAQKIEEAVTYDMTGAQKRVAVLKTRKDKIRDLATEELIAEWQTRAKEYEFDWQKLVKSTPEKEQPRRNYKQVDTAYSFSETNNLEKTYSKIATNLQQNQPRKGFKQEQVLFAALEATGENLPKAQNIAYQFNSQYIRKSRVNRRFRLNFNGHKIVDYRGMRTKIATTARRLSEIHQKIKRLGTEVKGIYLYSTGKISRKQYLLYKRHQKLAKQRWNREISGDYYLKEVDKIRRDKKITAYPWIIRSYQTLGLMSKKQADYWCKIVKEYRHPTPLDIIATRISSWDREPITFVISDRYQEKQRGR